MEKGFVRIKCANCGVSDRVEVYFPAYNKGFEAKEHRCRCCRASLMITDPYSYNENGEILMDQGCDISSGTA